MRIKAAVLIAMLCVMLGITTSAFAGGAGPGIHNGENPHTTGCDVGAVDVPGTSRPISIDNVPFGELVVRASTVCANFRWAELRYAEPKGYLLSVNITQVKPRGEQEFYTLRHSEAESPVFTNMYNQSGVCLLYGAYVSNESDGTGDSVVEELCELLSEPIPAPVTTTPVSNPGPSVGSSPPSSTTPATVIQQPKKVAKKKSKCRLVRVKVKHSKKTKLVRVCPKHSKKKASKSRPYGITITSGGGG